MQTLYTLDLTHIQHSIIGDEFERGISGGQRKRVNVGLELVMCYGLAMMRESIGYWNTFWESMGYLFLVTLVLTVINLMLISGTRLEKKV